MAFSELQNAMKAYDRYQQMFHRLSVNREGAFMPFTVLGDPSAEESLDVVDALVAGGADALELGFPYSDPIADGATIQAAAMRSLAAGTTPDICFRLLERIRSKYADLPIGLLVYSNLVVHLLPEKFFAQAAAAGADSVLMADVPSLEIEPYAELAVRAKLAPILIVAPNSDSACIARVVRWCRGFTYLLGREGVTGTETAMRRPSGSLIRALQLADAPPPIIGFGISTPEHVRAAIESGGRGAISGSAIASIIAGNLLDSKARLAALREFVASMKSATRNTATTAGSAEPAE